MLQLLGSGSGLGNSGGGGSRGMSSWADQTSVEPFISKTRQQQQQHQQLQQTQQEHLEFRLSRKSRHKSQVKVAASLGNMHHHRGGRHHHHQHHEKNHPSSSSSIAIVASKVSCHTLPPAGYFLYPAKHVLGKFRRRSIT